MPQMNAGSSDRHAYVGARQDGGSGRFCVKGYRGFWRGHGFCCVSSTDTIGQLRLILDSGANHHYLARALVRSRGWEDFIRPFRRAIGGVDNSTAFATGLIDAIQLQELPSGPLWDARILERATTSLVSQFQLCKDMGGTVVADSEKAIIYQLEQPVEPVGTAVVMENGLYIHL